MPVASEMLRCAPPHTFCSGEEPCLGGSLSVDRMPGGFELFWVKANGKGGLRVGHRRPREVHLDGVKRGYRFDSGCSPKCKAQILPHILQFDGAGLHWSSSDWAALRDAAISAARAIAASACSFAKAGGETILPVAAAVSAASAVSTSICRSISTSSSASRSRAQCALPHPGPSATSRSSVARMLSRSARCRTGASICAVRLCSRSRNSASLARRVLA